jgi:hypothetical protein
VLAFAATIVLTAAVAAVARRAALRSLAALQP